MMDIAAPLCLGAAPLCVLWAGAAPVLGEAGDGALGDGGAAGEGPAPGLPLQRHHWQLAEEETGGQQFSQLLKIRY